MKVRHESPGDVAAIDLLIASAFRDAPHTSHTEQFIVRSLRTSGNLTLSLVAEIDGRIVGHVALSPVSISDGSTGWYGLGPIAVAPDCQRRGIGSALMGRALLDVRELGAHGCVLVGEPEYYGRFGFRAEAALVFQGVPAQYFQAHSFGGTLPSGIVTYDPAFEAQA